MTQKGYWATEIEKAQKTIAMIKKSNLDENTKVYLESLLNDEIARCKDGQKYLGD